MIPLSRFITLSEPYLKANETVTVYGLPALLSGIYQARIMSCYGLCVVDYMYLSIALNGLPKIVFAWQFHLLRTNP